MGMFDTVMVPCPRCGHKEEAQSKGADEPRLAVYELADAPPDVLSNVNRHAPFTCDKCGALFFVECKVSVITTVREWARGPDPDDPVPLHKRG